MTRTLISSILFLVANRENQNRSVDNIHCVCTFIYIHMCTYDHLHTFIAFSRKNLLITLRIYAKESMFMFINIFFIAFYLTTSIINVINIIRL